jgi:hypothetical protein
MSQNKKTSKRIKPKKIFEKDHHDQLEKKIKNKASVEVFENEEASLQDKTYSYDDENTGDDDIHLVSDFKEESQID